MDFDATFFARLYLQESGSEKVRALVRTASVIRSSILAKTETEAALHRHLRERNINAEALMQTNRQIAYDQQGGLLEWLPLTASVVESVHRAYLKLPSTVYLRTGDATHLATASEAGFKGNLFQR